MPQPNIPARLLVTAALVALATCDSIDNLRISESSTTTIEGATLLEVLAGDTGFGDFVNMDITANQEMANQGVTRNQIDSVHLRSLRLTVTDPAEGQDFTFLESIAFFVEADGLDRLRIAGGGPFEEGLNSVGLDVDDVDIADYVAADSMSITTEVEGRRPENTSTVLAEIEIDVDIDADGALCGGS